MFDSLVDRIKQDEGTSAKALTADNKVGAGIDIALFQIRSVMLPHLT